MMYLFFPGFLRKTKHLTLTLVEGGKHVEHVEDAVKFKPYKSSTELIDGDDGQYAYYHWD